MIPWIIKMVIDTKTTYGFPNSSYELKLINGSTHEYTI